MLFGFAAGTDVGLRIVADRLSADLGQPVVIENVVGAAGNIAADRAANAEPDGYTVGMLTGANIVLRPLLSRKAAYDPMSRLVPVGLAFGFPNLIVVNNDVAAANFPGLIELARANPGALTFGHLGTGSVTHLTGELLKFRSGIDIRAVPYRGAATMLTDVMSGQVTMGIVPPSTALGLVSEGKLRALAMTSRDRVAFAKDIPTVAELGYAGFDTAVWFGLFVPSGTPQVVVDRLGIAFRKAMSAADVRERFYELGLVPFGSSQSDFVSAITAETGVWSRLIKEAGIEPIE